MGQGALVSIEACGVTLGGPHHYIGTHGPSVGDDAARLNGRCGGLLGDAAAEAIHHMRFVWMGILQQEQNAESLQLALGDIGDFAETVHALHEAGKEKED